MNQVTFEDERVTLITTGHHGHLPVWSPEYTGELLAVELNRPRGWIKQQTNFTLESDAKSLTPAVASHRRETPAVVSWRCSGCRGNAGGATQLRCPAHGPGSPGPQSAAGRSSLPSLLEQPGPEAWEFGAPQAQASESYWGLLQSQGAGEHQPRAQPDGGGCRGQARAPGQDEASCRGQPSPGNAPAEWGRAGTWHCEPLIPGHVFIAFSPECSPSRRRDATRSPVASTHQLEIIPCFEASGCFLPDANRAGWPAAPPPPADRHHTTKSSRGISNLGQLFSSRDRYSRNAQKQIIPNYTKDRICR